MIRSTLAVSAPAASTGLTTLANLKADLGIAIDDASEDVYLTAQIKRVSSQICSYLGIARASDGTARLGVETLIETFRLDRDENQLVFSRSPVIAVISVIEGISSSTITLVDGDFEVDNAKGMLYRLDGNDFPWSWTSDKVVVTYSAGWILPGDEDSTQESNLPSEIEDAAISWVKSNRAGRTRDPMVKGESVEGVGQISYWVGGVPAGADIPPDIAAKLDPFREMSI